ncbi:hypothetical protein RHMOL_Rhmol04G0340100 [Rhododendron molle]|uniref:Uncharacterized protein n=1 Tax=Rhododendron molle TaxID=49168 RepID=A0ACC0P7G0_RHOML|nr:hypothetical protein RHMOL_Rhmol04G0340100 [Rhododendron molle]
MLRGKWYQRKDVEIVNGRGDVLQCSHYMPIVRPEGKALPCVIYCHGNSGCRTDASEAAIILLPSNITVFTLDFSGSGLSGGEHVTLGWNELTILLAICSLMYGVEDPSIAGMVLDSPFSDLVDLMMELVDTYKVRLPKFTVKFAIQYMRRAILKKAKFDISELNTIKVAKSCFVPVLLGHAVDDDFIHPHHSDRIFDVYVGDKNIIKFDGDHNSPRPQFYFDSINIFFHNVLQPPVDEVGEMVIDTTQNYFGKVPSDMSCQDNHQSEAQMLMEAVLESLKDLDLRKPRLPDEPSSTETDPTKPSQGEKPDESTITDHCVSNGPNLASELKSPDTSESSMEPSSETAPSVVESGNIGVSANSETSPDIKSSSNTDTSDRTKATVTVERNPPSNMIEGLMRRWDFNFFRNNR